MSEQYVWLAMAAVPAFWIFVFWLSSHMTGWSRIARTYIAYHKPEGETFKWRSLEMKGSGRYGNSINVTLSFEGIHLQPFAPFRIGHAPLLLPWSLVTNVHSRTWLQGGGIGIEIEAEGKKLTVSLPLAAEELVARYRRMPILDRAVVEPEVEEPKLSLRDIFGK